jgi:hypothetical protein
LHVSIGSLRQYPAANGDRGITCHHNLASVTWNGNHLLLSHAQRIDTRNLSLAGCLVYVW